MSRKGIIIVPGLSASVWVDYIELDFVVAVDEDYFMQLVNGG